MGANDRYAVRKPFGIVENRIVRPTMDPKKRTGNCIITPVLLCKALLYLLLSGSYRTVIFTKLLDTFQKIFAFLPDEMGNKFTKNGMKKDLIKKIKN